MYVMGRKSGPLFPSKQWFFTSGTRPPKLFFFWIPIRSLKMLARFPGVPTDSVRIITKLKQPQIAVIIKKD